MFKRKGEWYHFNRCKRLNARGRSQESPQTVAENTGELLQKTMQKVQELFQKEHVHAGSRLETTIGNTLVTDAKNHHFNIHEYHLSENDSWPKSTRGLSSVYAGFTLDRIQLCRPVKGYDKVIPTWSLNGDSHLWHFLARFLLVPIFGNGDIIKNGWRSSPWQNIFRHQFFKVIETAGFSHLIMLAISYLAWNPCPSPIVRPNRGKWGSYAQIRLTDDPLRHLSIRTDQNQDL